MADLSTVLRELGDPTRLRVFAAILDGRKNVSAIVAELGLTQPQVSYHLRHLREVGLAAEEKDGRKVWYEASWETDDTCVREFLDLAARWLGAGTPGAVGGGRRGGRKPGRARSPRVRPAGSKVAPDGEGRPVVERPKKKPEMDDFLL